MKMKPLQDKPAQAPQAENSRHLFGPRGLATLIPPIVKPALHKRAPATAQLLADWAAIIGPALADVSTPRKLFQGTLAIACSGPVAMELQHLAPVLMNRINTHLGQIAVTRLRFVQDVQTQPSEPPARIPATEAAARAVDLPPGKLRDALLSLGAQVLSTSPLLRR
jgi:hypothetical protein